MRKLSKALRVDLLRSVFSGVFLLSIGLMLAWLMLCGWTYYTSDYAVQHACAQAEQGDQEHIQEIVSVKQEKGAE